LPKEISEMVGQTCRFAATTPQVVAHHFGNFFWQSL